MAPAPGSPQNLGAGVRAWVQPLHKEKNNKNISSSVPAKSAP